MVENEKLYSDNEVFSFNQSGQCFTTTGPYRNQKQNMPNVEGENSVGGRDHTQHMNLTVWSTLKQDMSNNTLNAIEGLFQHIHNTYIVFWKEKKT